MALRSSSLIITIMHTVQIIQNGKGYQWQETDDMKNVVTGQIIWPTPEEAKAAYQDYLQVDLVNRIAAKAESLAKADQWQGDTLTVDKE